MRSAAVKVRPGDKIRFSKINPDDMGRMTKEEACTRFVDSTRWAAFSAPSSLSLRAHRSTCLRLPPIRPSPKCREVSRPRLARRHDR